MESAQKTRGSSLIRWAACMRLLTLLPVSWPSFQVSNRDDDYLAFRMSVYDLIRKSLDQHSARSVIRSGRAYFGMCLNAGRNVNDGIEEFPAQSGPLLFVPKSRGRKLLACSLKVSDYSSHRPRMSFAMRRFTLSHDSSFSVPASRELTRRWISLAHAAEASGSAGPSRLAIISAASFARDFALRRRASASTDSVAFVIFPYYSRERPPNKRLTGPLKSAAAQPHPR